MNKEGYIDTEDCCNAEAEMDCFRCGIRIDTWQLMGVHCELCEMYFHKSCAGHCDCVISDTDCADDGGIHLDLTMLDEDADRDQGQ